MNMLKYVLEHYYIINLVLVVGLIALMLLTRNVVYQVFYQFTYFTFHYAYGYLPVFANDYVTSFMRQREGTHNIVNVMAVIFLCTSFIIMVWQNRNNIASVVRGVTIPISVKLYMLIIFAWFALAMTGIIIGNNGNLTKFFMIDLYLLILTALFALLLLSKLNLNVEVTLGRVARNIFIFLIIMVVAQCIQFALGKSWVCCDVIRPDAFLFNPNNLGFWLLAVSAFFLYVSAIGIGVRLANIAQILIAMSMLLSASRSFLVNIIFLHGMVMISAYAYNKRISVNVVRIITYFYSSVVFLCISLQLLSPIIIEKSIILERLQLNSDRLIFTPVVLYEYVSNDHEFPKIAAQWMLKNKSGIQPEAENLDAVDHRQLNDNVSNVNSSKKPNVKYQKAEKAEKVVKAEKVEKAEKAAAWFSRRRYLIQGGVANIDGRLSKEATDNGYRTLFRMKETNIVMLWLFILMMPLFLLFDRAFMRNASVQIVLAFYATCFFAGLSINIFYIFPIWPIMAITYSLLAVLAINHFYVKDHHGRESQYVKS